MKIICDTNEDLTSFVKAVIKEAEEFKDTEEKTESDEISDIAEKMDVEDVPDGESEDMNVTLEFDALVNLMGEEIAQKLYDLCCERGPNVPLTVADVEECCPEMTDDVEGFEVGEAEGEAEGFEVGEVEGEAEGFEVGEAEGEAEGFEVGEDVGATGDKECDADAGCDAMGTGDVAAGESDDVEGGLLDVAIGNDGETQTDTDIEGGEDIEGDEDINAEDDIEGGKDASDESARSMGGAEATELKKTGTKDHVEVEN